MPTPLNNLRIVFEETEPSLCMATLAEREWDHSKTPAHGLVLDFDRDGQLIGVEMLGRLAERFQQGLRQLLCDAGVAPTLLAD